MKISAVVLFPFLLSSIYAAILPKVPSLTDFSDIVGRLRSGSGSSVSTESDSSRSRSSSNASDTAHNPETFSKGLCGRSDAYIRLCFNFNKNGFYSHLENLLANNNDLLEFESSEQYKSFTDIMNESVEGLIERRAKAEAAIKSARDELEAEKSRKAMNEALYLQEHSKGISVANLTSKALNFLEITDNKLHSAIKDAQSKIELLERRIGAKEQDIVETNRRLEIIDRFRAKCNSRSGCKKIVKQ